MLGSPSSIFSNSQNSFFIFLFSKFISWVLQAWFKSHCQSLNSLPQSVSIMSKPLLNKRQNTPKKPDQCNTLQLIAHSCPSFYSQLPIPVITGSHRPYFPFHWLWACLRFQIFNSCFNWKWTFLSCSMMSQLLYLVFDYLQTQCFQLNFLRLPSLPWNSNLVNVLLFSRHLQTLLPKTFQYCLHKWQKFWLHQITNLFIEGPS